MPAWGLPGCAGPAGWNPSPRGGRPQPQLLLDGAHNQAGVEALVHSLTRGYQRERLVLVWGNMADKNLLPGLLALLPLR